jgi:hypothetical protein
MKTVKEFGWQMNRWSELFTGRHLADRQLPETDKLTAYCSITYVYYYVCTVYAGRTSGHAALVMQESKIPFYVFMVCKLPIKVYIKTHIFVRNHDQ